MKSNNKERLFEVMSKIDKSFKMTLNEAVAVPFTYQKKEFHDINDYKYKFNVEDIRMKCSIWHDKKKHYDGVYEVSFGTEEGGDFHRVGKDLKFLNTVLETVSECIKDFLNREQNVTKLYIEGAVGEGESASPWDSTVRTNAYLRFIKNKFPEYNVKNSGRDIEITIREKVNNRLEKIKDVIRTISDEIEIPEHYLQGSYSGENDWSVESDYGVNSNLGGFNIEILCDSGYYSLKIQLFDTNDTIEENFNSFEQMKNFILNYFNTQSSMNEETPRQIKVNPKYTHFAYLKDNNKIINGWDYRGYDNKELSNEKRRFFLNDIRDMQIDPKIVKVVTTKFLQRTGINPFDWSNWLPNEEYVNYATL